MRQGYIEIYTVVAPSGFCLSYRTMDKAKKVVEITASIFNQSEDLYKIYPNSVFAGDINDD